MEEEAIEMQEIFRFVKDSTDDAGTVHGQFHGDWRAPNFLKELRAYGIKVPNGHFDPSRGYDAARNLYSGIV